MPMLITRWRETRFPSQALHDLCERAFSKAGVARPPGWRPADWAAIEARPLPGQEVLVGHRADVLAGVAVTAVVDGVCDLMLIATDPDFARAGLGRALIAMGAKLAKPRGANRMMLEVSARNEAACAFYQAIGFIQTGRRRGYFGSGHDAIVMTRQIA